ncbi:MAG: aspartate--tRNA ligase [Minisyncoccales bacterium]
MKKISIEETINHKNKKVTVAGWVHSRRDHGKIIFIDLRDRTGIIQVLFNHENKEVYKKADNLRGEWVVKITGNINQRPENMYNEEITTGQIELEAEKIEILSKSETPPIAVDNNGYEIGEENRLKYRYLDLRRERMAKNLKKRHQSLKFIRDFLDKKDFIEVETPILTKSTPEGARDFIVPSRLKKGEFFALPQAPQQFKQLLMVSGIEKYFQIARVFRDEGSRADRQPEFTQLDLEESFSSPEKIMNLMEKLCKELTSSLFPEKKITKDPFPRINYKEAMDKYNTDAPDLRKEKDNPDELAFAFIVNFPMFERKPGKGNKWGAMHNPFTKPKTNDIEKIKKEPENIMAHQYDLVLNGYEIGGGSTRIIDLKLLTAVFEVLGHSKKETKEKFANYYEAFKYGVPPHGGIALGLDRLLAKLLNEENIREVIAFPKTGDQQDLLMNAPSEINQEQLDELGLELKEKEEEKDN